MQSMPTIETEKSHALKVLQSFLLKLESATDPSDIEADMYAIMRVSEKSYQQMHMINGAVRP